MCASIPRPCPRLRCQFNLRAEWSSDPRAGQSGRRPVVEVRPDDDPRASCALDVAADGPASPAETERLIERSASQTRLILQHARERLRELRLLDEET